MWRRNRGGTDLGVPGRDVFVGPAVLLVWMGAVGPDHVDVSGDDEAEDLLSRPKGAGLDDGRLGDLAVPRGEEHQQVHHLSLPWERAADEVSNKIPTVL